MVLTTLLAAAMLLGLVEWRHYRMEMEWSRLETPALLRAVMAYLLWVKSLFLMAAPLLLAGLLVHLRRRRLAWSVYLLSTVLIGAWLALDALAVELSGRHLQSYLPYLFSESAFQWVGGEQTALTPIASILGAVLFGVIIVAAAMSQFGKRVDRRQNGVDRPSWTPMIVYLLALFVGPIAPRLVDDGSFNHFTRLAHYLPLPMPWLGGGGFVRGEQETFCKQFEQAMRPWLEQRAEDLWTHRPADDSMRIEVDNPPNVILFILESLRWDVLSPEVMTRLDALSRRGLRFEKHYAAANNSVFGTYALMHARTPYTFHRDLAYVEHAAPQWPGVMARSGYQSTLLTSSGSSLAQWREMGKFFNAAVFDRLIEEKSETPADWPANDLKCLDHIGRLIKQRDTEQGPAQFIVAYLMSTHYDYRFPVNEAPFGPIVEGDLLNMQRSMDRSEYAERLLNRYRNSAAYLDRIIGELIDEIDLQRNVIIITGDHGQSIWDDGHLAHGSVLSEIQTRVPMMIVGAGAPQGRIDRISTHMDVLPTLLHLLTDQSTPLAYAHGRDLLAETIGPDRAMLAHWDRRDEWYLLLIQNDLRFLIELDVRNANLRAVGFVDESMRPLLTPPTQQTPQGWAKRFQSYFEDTSD